MQVNQPVPVQESQRLEVVHINDQYHSNIAQHLLTKVGNIGLLFAFCLPLLFQFGCANPIAPTGGPKDETPPTVIEGKSTPNFQTNFKPETIELTFDEWVKVQNANQQVLISPPFDGYSVRLKGKTLIFDFGDKDTLRNDVTYVIQFGETVKDLTESNPTENLRFVFATGPEIDSLEMNGKVIDAYTAEPIDKALVLIYDNLADSVFRTERPFYFGITDEDGRFNISNMRAGNYKVCALVDSDGNYKFSQISEPIAFLEEPVMITGDSSANLSLQVFQEQIPLLISDTDDSKNGLLQLTFNQDPSVLLNAKGDVEFSTSFEKDTAFIWHTATEDWTLFLSADTTFYDTIKVASSEEGESFQNIQLYRLPSQDLSPYPGKAFALGFSSPVQLIDTSKMTLLADTLLDHLSFSWSVDSLETRRVWIDHPFKESTDYLWTALPGAVTNIWGHQNTDTLSLKWTSSSVKSFGNLHIQFSTDDPDAIYLVKLLQKGKEAVRTFQLAGSLHYDKNAKGIPPGEYQLEIILDQNANGRWDTGHYDARLQAEKVIIRPLEQLRANWDLDVEVDLSNSRN